MQDVLHQGGCLPSTLAAVNAAIACVDGLIASLAFSQLLRIHLCNQQLGWTRQKLLRIHLCNQQLGWTRQKVIHLMIGLSNLGFLVYFITTIFAACGRWYCWSHACGFILMACPQILFLAAFLLLLSFWVDLCHQASDDEEEEATAGVYERLLEKSETSGLHQLDNHQKCLPFHWIHVGTRQKFVILVIMVVFVLMMAFAALIWVGKGKNPIDSSVVSQVYLDLFSVVILLLGGALACYGILLAMKMSKVRSDKSSSEMWKVAGLAVVSILCFSSCALVALITSIPALYHWDSERTNVSSTSLLIIVYYFIGFSVPSGFLLWILREMPRRFVVCPTQARVVTFIRDRGIIEPHTRRWTAVTSSQNRSLKASPI